MTKYYVYSKLTWTIGTFKSKEEAEEYAKKIEEENKKRYPKWKAVHSVFIYSEQNTTNKGL